MVQSIKNTLLRLTRTIHKRERRLIYSSVSSVGVKITTILSSILLLPLILNSIGSERYGMLLTITSIAAVINFADLGLGFGLQNKIPSLVLEGDYALHKAISSAFAFLLFSSVLIIGAFALFSQNITWHEVLHLKSRVAIEEANISVWLFAILFAIAIPFSIIQKIQIGLQEGYYTNFWTMTGNIISIILVYIVYIYDASTPMVILAMYGTNTAFIFLNFVHQFLWKRPHLLPRYSSVDFNIIKSIIGDSLFFFIVQFAGLILFASNNAYLIHLSGPEAVANFNVGYKLALLMLVPLEALAPYLTPAVNEATLKSDYSWVRKTVRRSLLLATALAVLSACVVYFFGNTLINFWVGQRIVLNNETLRSIALFMLLYANLGCVISYIMLSSAFIKYKVFLYTVAVVISVSIKYIWIKHSGIAGAFWSTGIPMFLLFVLPCLLILKSKRIL